MSTVKFILQDGYNGKSFFLFLFSFFLFSFLLLSEGKVCEIAHLFCFSWICCPKSHPFVLANALKKGIRIFSVYFEWFANDVSWRNLKKKNENLFEKAHFKWKTDWFWVSKCIVPDRIICVMVVIRSWKRQS